MNRRRFIGTVGGGLVFALAGCADTQPNSSDSSDSSEFTPSSGEENLKETNENIDYPPGLAKNRIDIDTFMEKTPFLQDDEKPSSVSFKASEEIRNGEELQIDRSITNKIDIDVNRMHRNRKTLDSHIERFKINGKLFKASFTNSNLESVSEVTTKSSFVPRSDSGYERVKQLVEPFSVTSHTIKKDDKTGNLVHFYTSDTSDSRLPESKLKIGFFESGLINFIEVSYTNTEKKKYTFILNFDAYGKTTVEKPDWFSKR